MAKRPSPRLLIAVGVAVVVLLAIVGLVRTLLGTPGLTEAQYARLMESGSLAQIENTLTSGPVRPTIDLAQQQVAYSGAQRCTTYWRNAQQHLLSQTSHVPDNPEQDFVGGFGTELWDDPSAAQSAITDWAVCLEEFQSLSGARSYPLKVVNRGTTSGVAWQYAESLDLDNPVRILTLRDRNVVAVFELPDAPDGAWRDVVADRFHASIEKAAAS